MPTKIFTKCIKVGDDELSWWQGIQQVAINFGCTVTSLRGSMWRSSRGREIVYLVSAESTAALNGFTVGITITDASRS